MFERLAAQLARIADALERSANRGPTEDVAAREAIAALVARLDGLAARVDDVEEGDGAALLKRILALEARADKAESDHRSLRGKVYRDPEFHKPEERAAHHAGGALLGRA